MSGRDSHRPVYAVARRMIWWLLGLSPLVLGLIVWQVLADPASVYFPPPSEWYAAAYKAIATGSLLLSIYETIKTFLLALVACIVVGSIVGILVGRSVAADITLNPFLEFLRTLPAGALVPIGVIVIGYTNSMSVAVVLATAVWPILLNTRHGAKTISPIRLQVAEVLHLTTRQRIQKIILPTVFGSILVGVKIASPIVLIITILVEMLTQTPGIGQELALAQQTYNSSLVYALIVIAGLLGTVINVILRPIDALGRRYSTGSSVR